jgi:hypothetical protein
MFTLWITDHALRRFVELFPDHESNLPKHVSHILDAGAMKRLTKTLKFALKMIAGTTRVTLTAKKQWGKFIKHGIQNEIYLCTKDWVTFVVVVEGSSHTIVTITRPPKENRDAEIDDSMENPSGAIYLKQASGVVLPYRLAAGVVAPNTGLVNAMHDWQVQAYFGKGDHDRKVQAQKLPLQPR